MKRAVGHSESLERESGEENEKEREPKINIKFFFASHNKPADWEKLGELIRQTDIYVVEEIGWNERGMKEYNQISFGEITPDETEAISRLPILEKELDALYNSRKPVVSVDLPAGHPLTLAAFDWIESANSAVRHFISGEFEKALTGEREAIEESVRFDQEREKYIRSAIKFLVEKLKNEFKNKDEVSVLVRFGGGHTGLRRDVQGEGVTSTTVFSDSPFVFPFGLEAERVFALKGQVSNEILARALIEEALTSKLDNITNSTTNLIRVLRKIVSKLTLDDIREVSLALGHGEDLAVAVEARGVKIPESEEQVEAMLGKQKSKATA